MTHTALKTVSAAGNIWFEWNTKTLTCLKKECLTTNTDKLLLHQYLLEFPAACLQQECHHKASNWKWPRANISFTSFLPPATLGVAFSILDSHLDHPRAQTNLHCEAPVASLVKMRCIIKSSYHTSDSEHTMDTCRYGKCSTGIWRGKLLRNLIKEKL